MPCLTSPWPQFEDGRLECLFRYSPLNQNQFTLDFTSYFSGAVADQHVHLAAYTEFAGQINPRLDGKTGVGNDLAIILGLQVINVGAVAVDVHADGMSG